MNASHRLTLLLGVVALVVPSLPAADPAPPPPRQEKGGMRVITSTDRPRPGPRGPMMREREKEIVTFLGIQAVPVSRTLTAQLGLPEGAGLIVNEIEPGSPAAGVLNQDDILLKLDDQLLIETRQLAVLVRQHKEGDEVTLTYLRSGKQATARVKLARHEVPKMSGIFEPALPGQGIGALAFGRGSPAFAPEMPREEVDRMLSMIQRGPRGEPIRIQIDRRAGPGVSATSVNPGNSNLVYTDEAGSLELTMKDGEKTLVARNADGKEIFSGPVNTPAERGALPPDVRTRLEKLEGMRELTFRTDADFKGAERRIVQPLGRGISLPPVPAQPRTPRLAPAYF